MAGGKQFIPEIRDQKTIDETVRKHGHMLERSWRTSEQTALSELGIETERVQPTTPVIGGVPNVFLVKDGKVSTLEESGLALNTAEFSKAILLGQVFAYPAGKTQPVQLQLLREERGIDLNLHWSAPLSIDPNDPSPERRKTADAIHARFGALREKTDFQAEADEMARRKALRIQQQKEYDHRMATRDNGKRQYGIEVVENVYARAPVLREDFVAANQYESRPYQREDFDKLIKSDIDLSQINVNTNDRITEREFAVLSLFASLEPDVVVEHQQIAAADPAPVLKGFQNLGFSEQEAKEVLNMCNSGAYTLDVLGGETRNGNNIHAFNAGRQKAADALTAYKKDAPDDSNMEKLAEILSRAVEYAGYYSGATTDNGAPGLAKLATEAINIMDRDPALRDMAKRKYEQRDGSFCDRHPFYRHKTFEEQIRDIRAMDRYSDMVQKGKDAETALLGARAGKLELTEEQKKAYTRDVVRAGMLEAHYCREVLARQSSETNENQARFETYIGKLQERLLAQDEGEELEGGIKEKEGGSSIPSNTPSVLVGAMQSRLTGTAPTLANLSKPSWLAQLEAETEAIVALDGLDALSLDALAKKSGYYLHGNNKNAELMERSAQIMAQKKAEPPRPEERPKKEPNPLDQAVPYAVQRTTYTQAEREKDDYYTMAHSLVDMEPVLRSLGIFVNSRRPVMPTNDGEPLIFMVKDGKAMTLEEGNVKFGARDFGEAMKMGQIFAFPAGSREAVQLRFSSENPPVKAGYSKLTDFPKFEQPPELTHPQEPRWYHRLFRFGNNARICEAYDAEQQRIREWEAKTKAAKAQAEEMGNAIMAIEQRFGATRSQDVLDRELADWREAEEQTVRAKLESTVRAKQNASKLVETYVEVVDNMYAAKPQVQEKFVKDNLDGTTNEKVVVAAYDRETFGRFTDADIDPEKVQLGGKPLTEKDFATVALYAAHDPEVAYLNQKNAVNDPEPIIADFAKEGVNREDAMEALLCSNCTAYSIDILNGEKRIQHYVGAINEGRKRAAEALKAYPGDKTKLAEIFSRAVAHTGAPMGVLSNTGSEGYARMGVRAIELMDRDPELRRMAKERYDKRTSGLAQRHGQLFRFVSFEDQIKAIRGQNEFSAIQQRGAEGELTLAKANLNRDGVPLTPEERQKAVRDVLKAKHTRAVFTQQRRNADRAANRSEEAGRFEDYTMDLLSRYPDAMTPKGLARKGAGSTLPGTMPTIVLGGVRDGMADKCEIVFDMTNPKWSAALDQTLDQIIKEDGLVKLSEAELLEKLENAKAYQGEQLIQRAADAARKLEEPKAEPQLKPAAEKKQEKAAGDLSADGPVAGV